MNNFVTFASGEKIVKCIIVSNFRNDIYLAFLSKFGQIKRMALNVIETSRRNRPVKCMRLLNGDEIASIQILTGNSDLLVMTSGGYCSLFNENELNLLGAKAGGVKSISGLGKQQAVSMIAFDEEEKNKIALVTDKGCLRIYSNEKVNKTARLGKPTIMYQCFKNDIHKLIGAVKLPTKVEKTSIFVKLLSGDIKEIEITNFYITDVLNAKKNTDIPKNELIDSILDCEMEVINKDTISHPITIKQVEETEISEVGEEDKTPRVVPSKTDSTEEKEESSYEQISIFDDIDE